MSSKPERPQVAILGDGLGHHMAAALHTLLAEGGIDVIALERAELPPSPTISIESSDFPDFMYKPNRKERRADAARARRRR